jgi:hypothetical protein
MFIFIYMLNHIERWTNNFENMNFMMYWWGIKYLKNILMFHSWWIITIRYGVLHLNFITLFKWRSIINVTNFAIPYLFESICTRWSIENGISLKKCPFVSWFRILSQYDVSIYFLLHFGILMQYPSKFQKICYRTQRIYGIPYKGYCKYIEYS